MKSENGFSAVNLILSVLLIVLAGLGAWYWQQIKIDDLKGELSGLQAQVDASSEDQEEADQVGYLYESAKGVEIEVFKPERDSEAASPLTVIGRVPGNWSFEASFPIELVDADGTVLGRANAQIVGDWMTEELVPFTAEIEFEDSAAMNLRLVLHKDNPSGLEANEDSVSVPLR